MGQYRGRILIVDDEPGVCGVLARLFQRDYLTAIVNDGIEALALVEAGREYDTILCDIQMRQMSGADFRDAVYRVDAALGTRMIFMTGDPASSKCDRVRDHLIITKPFERQKLCALVSRVVAAARSGYFPARTTMAG